MIRFKELIKDKKARSTIIRFGLLILCALISLCCLGRLSSLSKVSKIPTAAETYRGSSEIGFSQISAYFPYNGGTDLNGIYSFRSSLLRKYLDVSLEESENQSLYIDAWCAQTSLNISSDASSGNMTVYGVGGNFFYFHPLQLRSGSYFSDDDLMRDYAILNEEAAWKLFGGVDLTGLEIRINDKPYVISGVVSMEDDFATAKAMESGPVVFLSYDALNAISETSISCYEIAAANPVKSFAYNAVKEGFSAASVIEGSKRFSYGNIWEIIKTFPQRQMVKSAFVYPYWENAARYIETLMAPLLILGVAFAIPPAVYVFYAAIHYGRRGVREGIKQIPKRIDAHRAKRYYGAQQKK